jgi:protein SCO1
MMARFGSFAAAAAALLGALLLAACEPKPAAFNNVDITGADYARDFALTGHDGKPHRLADFRGRVVVVFFGFAQCPDVCPTTLSDLAQVKQQLGADGDRLQVVFVTVDPERDTQSVLAQYMANFDPAFLALTGTAEQIAQTAREFKVFYQKVPGKTETSYTIDHTAGSYVFDKDGRLRLFLKHGQGVDPIVADLRRLL